MVAVTVGIVTYNSRDDIGPCLHSLQAQTFTDFEVIVLDNASSDCTVERVAQDWPAIRLIRSTENIGFGRAHNHLIGLTRSPFYMPLNPDVTLTPTYLAAMVGALSDPAYGWASGKLYLRDDRASDPPRLYTTGHAVFQDGFAVNIGHNLPEQPIHTVQREVFGANGAAPLYRREMLDAVQLLPGEVFDATIFLYHEDTDLDWRARLLGWRCVYTPDAVGYHAGDGSAGQSMPTIAHTLKAARYYSIFKHAPLFDLLTYNLPTFALHSLFLLLTSPRTGWATLRYIWARRERIRQQRALIAPRRQLSRRDLLAWYAWSRQQDSGYAYTYLARFWRWRVMRRFTAPRS